ncbi:exosortase C-terminal domain/associated protein EpsI [Geobacter sp.]|uniref:exosortase C-terminal domain/associated protein EpsI n=1 Tax=Geobacter sp. TaxID=46610 RepID=UPI00261FEF67|nr:exosortase C-terminal domain/associated protein EpsI [Geobacter sp.]
MRLKHTIVLLLFALAGALTFFCRVERHAQAKSVNLAAIPAVIGEWRMVSQDTTLGAKEEKFLDDVLVRTYQRPDGKTVMLAVAYGADQRKNFSIHLPEVCYKASGCNVTSVGQASMDSPRLNLKQMVAKRSDGGVEAVQYWIVLDGKVVTSDFERKWKQAYLGTFGADAGGVLVRVSSFVNDGDFRKNYEFQKDFITVLYKSISSELLRTLYGNDSRLQSRS